MDLATMMALQPYGDDSWVGVGPQYPWGGLYGGQIVAQGLRAAAATVDPAYRVHSLHASFVRAGSHTEKILLEVDRVRDGRSFCNRRVTASQAVGAILTMTASFQVDEEGDVAVQAVRCPPVPDPGDVTSDRWSSVFDRRLVPGGPPGRMTAWMRVLEPVGDPELQRCALAFLTDDLPTDAVVALHPDRTRGDQFHNEFFSASLDHAVWFHRPLAVDEWHIHAYACHGLVGARGVAVGHVFSADGTHAATVSQEVVLRKKSAMG